MNREYKIPAIQKNVWNLPVVYVSGKVSGLPIKEVKKKFAKAQAELEAQGFFVLNPVAIIDDEQCEYQTAMRISVILLAYADSIYLLHDWQQSPGAQVEHAVAVSLGISTIYA